MAFSLQLAWRYLAGRPLRSSLTLLAVVFGVQITFGLQGVLPAVQASFLGNLTLAAHEVDLIVTPAGGESFGPEVLDQMRGTPGVAVASPVLERGLRLPAAYALPAEAGPPITDLTINGIDPATSAAVIPIRPTAGRWLQPGDTRAAMVRASLAEKAGLGLGDQITLPAASGGTAVTIVGILPSRVVFGDEELYLSLSDAQALFGEPGRISAVVGQASEGQEVNTLRAALQARLGPGLSVGSIGAGSNEWAAALRVGEIVFTLFGALAMAMGGFILLNTFRTGVAERRRDLGMLRAVGAERRTLIRVILAEGLILGLAGTAVGMLSGSALISVLLLALSPRWEQFFGAPLGAPEFGARAIVLSVGLGVGVPLLSGLLPALAAGRVPPLEALRPQAGPIGRGPARQRMAAGLLLLALAAAGLLSGAARAALLGALALLIGLIVLGPLLVRPAALACGRLIRRLFPGEGAIAEGNLLRNPGRSAITASTITISLAILVALAGLTSTFTDGLMGYLERSMRADYLLLPEALVLGQNTSAADPSLAERLRRTPGIAAVTTIRRSSAQIDGATVQLIGIDPATYPGLAGLQFTAGDEATAYRRLAAGDAIILNGVLAAQLGLAPGQAVTISTPAGPRTLAVVGVGIDYLNSRVASGYISQALMAEALYQRSDVLLMANRAADAPAPEVEAALLELARDYPAFSLLSYDQWRESQLAGNQTRTNILYLLMAILAAPALIALANTLAIAVMERTREIGVLRAIGGTRGQVQRLIVAESLLLSALGTIGGILAGVALGYGMVAAIRLGGLSFSYSFPTAGALLAAAIGLGFGVLAALLPARRVARLDIVAALRYE